MKLKNHFLWITWALIIIVLTMIPGKAIPNVEIFGIDKLVHFFIFGVLNFLMLAGFKDHTNSIRIAINFSIAYGIIIEFIQYYIPGRSLSIYDMIANSIGVILGYFIFKITTSKKTT